jgi:hypothetical protein
MTEVKFYLREFISEECQCGKYKKSQMSFCYPCYKSLPRDLQRNLYNRLGNGYEEAYDEALTYLTS